MAHVSQADFARAARGAEVSAGESAEIEPIIGGISSVARAAVRRVHRESAQAAVAYFNGKTAKWLLVGGWAAGAVRAYRGSLGQYITWDGGSGTADLDVGLRASPIVYSPADSVRAHAHVVSAPSNGQRTARVLLWDELPIDAQSAEMIALPVLERVQNVFGPNAIATIDVWQLAQPQGITVTPAAANARRPEVEALLASI